MSSINVADLVISARVDGIKELREAGDILKYITDNKGTLDEATKRLSEAFKADVGKQLMDLERAVRTILPVTMAGGGAIMNKIFAERIGTELKAVTDNPAQFLMAASGGDITGWLARMGLKDYDISKAQEVMNNAIEITIQNITSTGFATQGESKSMDILLKALQGKEYKGLLTPIKDFIKRALSNALKSSHADFQEAVQQIIIDEFGETLGKSIITSESRLGYSVIKSMTPEAEDFFRKRLKDLNAKKTKTDLEAREREILENAVVRHEDPKEAQSKAEYLYRALQFYASTEKPEEIKDFFTKHPSMITDLPMKLKKEELERLIKKLKTVGIVSGKWDEESEILEQLRMMTKGEVLVEFKPPGKTFEPGQLDEYLEAMAHRGGFKSADDMLEKLNRMRTMQKKRPATKYEMAMLIGGGPLPQESFPSAFVVDPTKMGMPSTAEEATELTELDILRGKLSMMELQRGQIISSGMEEKMIPTLLQSYDRIIASLRKEIQQLQATSNKTKDNTDEIKEQGKSGKIEDPKDV